MKINDNKIPKISDKKKIQKVNQKKMITLIIIPIKAPKSKITK